MSNHEWTQILTGFGKGCCTDTILTDQAKEMTVLRDRPYRTNVAKEMQPVSHLGARAMHKSTLTLGRKSAVSDYTSSYKQYFISQKAQPIIKYSGYPDEIKHLGVNTDGKEHLTTHREAFFVKEVIPRRILNKTVVENRMKNTQGLAMKEITTATSGRASYCTSYSSVHGIRAHHPTSAHIAELQPKRHTHNIITGEEGPSVQPTNYKRKSGDWLQQCSRQRGCFYDRFFLY
ncbi:uncharacterized protein LOC109934750 isoform X2 [Rhincodon typus]|uniref:uncharacterized protein LOC109934750 isoform X2 n=1 Tax=Rhincodon typus TaxID=259920 RepID=UPI00202EF6A6|nr:uncharacterized protein LOC109934750 isoform X2 [Rhincodon typus]